MASYGDDEVYYGSVPVSFVKVPGDTVVFKASEWQVDTTSLPAVLERAKPQVGPRCCLAHTSTPWLNLLVRVGPWM